MKKYDYYYTSKPKTTTKYAVLGLLTIFFLTITTFTLIEVKNFYYDEPAVVKILLNSFKSSKAEETPNTTNNKYVLMNLEEQQNREYLTKEQLNSERQARAASTNENTNSTQLKSNTYYEEQRPVVVYSKTDTDPSIALRQMAEVPPKQDKDDEEDPYSKALEEEDYETGNDNDYFGQTAQRSQPEPQSYYRQQPPQQQPYYRPQQQSPPPYYRQQQAPQPYYRQQPAQSPYYQTPANNPYYDDSSENFRGPDKEPQTSEEARSSQYQEYANYYRQHPYITPPPLLAAGTDNGKILPANSKENRKMPTVTSSKVQQQNRDPYPAYMDDYDYMPPQSHSPLPPQHPYAKRPGPPQQPQYRTPSTPSPAEQKPETNQQMDYLKIFKSLKTMWDLYQSFTSSWNTIAERRNREEAIAQQKYKQMQQIRINSKKPPKFNNKKNNTQTTKNPRKQTTTTTTVQPALNSLEVYTSSEEEVAPVKKQPLAKVEPRKGAKTDKGNNKEVESLRDKRQIDGVTGSTEVAEGRYIKGDPLKGYYDFVITEGSYKFWAAFQVGTAILIIYSTFAAIYYSKVNPLVSDYDYTDYLGGARSLDGGDLDFVDDDSGVLQKAQPKSWLEYLPRSGHSLKFILDAIDKLPTDHNTHEESNGEVFSPESKEVKDNFDGIEYEDDLEPSNEPENTQESDNSNETKQDNTAM